MLLSHIAITVVHLICNPEKKWVLTFHLHLSSSTYIHIMYINTLCKNFGTALILQSQKHKWELSSYRKVSLGKIKALSVFSCFTTNSLSNKTGNIFWWPEKTLVSWQIQIHCSCIHCSQMGIFRFETSVSLWLLLIAIKYLSIFHLKTLPAAKHGKAMVPSLKNQKQPKKISPDTS